MPSTTKPLSAWLVAGLFAFVSGGLAFGQPCDPGCNVPGGDADVNDDCAVDLSDLAVVLANFGAGPGAGHGDGDTNFDGVVDLTDLANLLSVFGTACDGPPGPLIIFGFGPQQVTSGDVVRIFGRGFGNDPDDLCVATTGGVFLEAFEANDQEVLARVVDLPDQAGGGVLMVARGEGFRQPIFDPAPLPGIEFEEDIWVWQGNDDPNDHAVPVDAGPLEPNRPNDPNDPNGPGLDPNNCTQYWQADGTGGLELELAGDWSTGDRFSIFLRAYCLVPFVRAPDVHIPCIRITDPAPTPEKCAEAICHAIVTAYANAGIVIDCVVTPGPVIRISYPDCPIDGPDWGPGGGNPSYIRCK